MLTVKLGQKNPLRVLDCKEETCQKVIHSPAFPLVQDFLCEECREYQDDLMEILRELDISFSINPLFGKRFRLLYENCF